MDMDEFATVPAPPRSLCALVEDRYTRDLRRRGHVWVLRTTQLTTVPHEEITHGSSTASVQARCRRTGTD
jgi:hypothetical protein